MTSMERVLTALGHREPDRVPFFLLLTLHGAKELGLGIKDYFAKPEQVVEGQLRLRKKYRHDCLYAFHYAAVEVEAWGGEVRFFDDGPPNAGAPFITDSGMIASLRPPEVDRVPVLRRVLETIAGLKARVGDEVPIFGVVMSPFALPVMQMGFEAYLNLLLYDRPRFQMLMEVNVAFSTAWAQAQLAAGATAICYFDPLLSTTILPRELLLETGFPLARRLLAAIPGATAIHLASGRALPVVGDMVGTGAVGLGVSALEDLGALKAACRGRITLIGNLNGLAMCRWTPQEAERQVREAIAKAGSGGGFILSDNHGEIPWQVPDGVLMAVSDAVHAWGRYPLNGRDGGAV